MVEARDKSKAVLMLLYHFPPIGGISMSRNARIVQRLPDNGWSPVVVAPESAVSEPNDPASLSMVATDLDLHRTAYLELHHLRPLVDIARVVLSRFRRGSAESDVAIAAASTEGGDLVGGSFATERIAWVRRRLMFPDNQAGWFPFAFWTGWRLARRESVDVLFSTSPPATAHLAAGLIAHLTRIPWVAEFRDPWLGNALEQPHPWIERRLRTKAERWIVRSATEVIGVTPRLARTLRQRYPSVRVATITNGYERDELSEAPSGKRADGPFTLVYTGTLDRPAELEVFLRGVAQLVEQRPSTRGRLAIEFYGTVSSRCREIADGHSAISLAGMITFHGFVSREQALGALARADAALVLLGDGPGMDLFMPGKLYDYIGADRQVFAMLPPGDAREMLVELGWGVLADPHPTSVEEALQRLLDAPQPARRADPDGRYGRASLTRRLAGVLDAATASRVPGPGIDD